MKKRSNKIGAQVFTANVQKSVVTTRTLDATLVDDGRGSFMIKPYDFEVLTKLVGYNSYHARCIALKATLTVGLGYELQGVDGGEADASQLKTVKDFFDRHSTYAGKPFFETISEFLVDYETYGHAFLEVVRDNAGRIGEVYHLPTRDCSYVREIIKGSKETRVMLEQRVGNDKTLYKPLGSHEGLKRNEFVEMKNYSPLSKFYGTPDYASALGALLLDRSAVEFNIRRFENNAVPDFIVTVSGGTVDNASIETLKSYWEKNLKGVTNNGKTLLLQSNDSEVEIKIEKLATEIKDASFHNLRADTRDEIISAHGVPPRMLGIVSSGQSLGGNNESKEQMRVFLEVVLKPRQTKVEFLFNEVLFKNLGLDKVKLRLNRLEIAGSSEDASFFKSMYDMDVLDAEEIREELGYKARIKRAVDKSALKLMKAFEKMRKTLEE